MDTDNVKVVISQGQIV